MRSLILAGGGMKVAYQAGWLQVLLDEAKLEFDHVDAASGGCFNAALWAGGRSGTEIAALWRTTNPRHFITPDFRAYRKLIWARSIGTSAGVRRVLRDDWKLNYQTIRGCTHPVFTFNHFNFANKSVSVVENRDLDEDLLVAAVTLLMWTPPVRYAGEWLFDAVWCTDGNVSEAVLRGADEIWAIWTVTDAPEMRGGFLANYFHLIETVADAKFTSEWKEIEAVNAAILTYGPDPSRATPDLRLAPGFDGRRPMPPPPGRKSVVEHLIRQEVGMHYVLNLSRDRAAAAVELGVADARAYLRTKGLLPSATVYTSATLATPVRFAFHETLRGFFMPGGKNSEESERDGRRAANAMTLRLRIETHDLDALLHDPAHPAELRGTVDAPLLCGTRMDIDEGRFAPFVDERVSGIVVPAHKRMLYTLRFRDGRGTRYLFEGEKILSNEPGHWFWPDTTTVFARLSIEAEGVPPAPFGAGIVRVHVLDLLASIVSLALDQTGSPSSRAGAVGRYLAFFLGRCWDVYLRGLLDYAPF